MVEAQDSLTQARTLLEQAEQPDLLADLNGRAGDTQTSLAEQIVKL